MALELGQKSRETVILYSNLVKGSLDETMRETVANMKEYSSDFLKRGGNFFSFLVYFVKSTFYGVFKDFLKFIANILIIDYFSL